ncbi:hypothetical protein TBLA_0B06460 [Henningerozyma blattae CBS 6284]|uniref:Cytochrome b-c1 complex subunit 10 n=1 Tax=Henningerozyma blattae (strain ATCC 34711 / CBS 6284 / DSM 70876 / NBRC 10599 / NRRL Y-10934 / UCD 77-7) TaxID=1071380 RepID=I2GZB7_HENB6|nr:hypothetical protein TBLA_0B06460 [Tetrapisispora blattae CBS 6284]CCH59469.1 hypothetical protein TBLA_0B06460 [Tetrapisispora blattae CBS 6284]
MVSYTSKFSAKGATRFGNLTLRNTLTYSPNLMLWGGASLAGIFVFVEGWPLFQETFFRKIPVYGSYWAKKLPPPKQQEEDSE